MKATLTILSAWLILLASTWTCFAQESNASNPPSAEDVLKRYAKELKPIWSDGETATVMYKGEAADVKVWFGGKLLEMKRLEDSDVWIATAKLPEVEKGILNYSYVITQQDGSIEKGAACSWRGKHAPDRVAVSPKLKGEVNTFEIESKYLSTKTRKVSVYTPPQYENEGVDSKKSLPVIYMADGGAVSLYASVAEPLIDAGRIPPFVIIGVHNGGYLGKRKPDFSDYDANKDLRAAEYLLALGSEHFPKHERFFCEEVIGWAESNYRVDNNRANRIVLGHSNGGRFAATMGIKHPEKFGHVIAFSPGAGNPPEFKSEPPLKSTYYLAAGTWEEHFHSLAQEFHHGLKLANFDSTFCSRVSGHDETMWQEEFSKAIQKILSVEN